MISQLTKCLHESFPTIPIYTEKVTKQAKTNFQIQIINTNTTATCSNSFLESNLYSLVYTVDPNLNTNTLIDDMRRNLLFVLEDYFYQVVDFTKVDNTLHCLFMLDQTISTVPTGDFLDSLAIQPIIR